MRRECNYCISKYHPRRYKKYVKEQKKKKGKEVEEKFNHLLM